MDLSTLQRHWEEFARSDPLWAILSVDSKRGRRWEVDEFFSTGGKEVEALVSYLGRLGVPRRRCMALDFGCGVGRVTQALCDCFEHTTGLDIAPSMIEAARRFNRHGHQCDYVLNDCDDLSAFDSGSIDLVYSNIVLQHMRPEYSQGYIREFVRVLRPDGVAVFQLPSEWLGSSHEESHDVHSLPDGAFKARIMVSEESLSVQAGESFSLRATVHNIGDTTWPAATQKCVIQLGNHWRDHGLSLLVRDDARVKLPADVLPDAKATLILTTNAPSQPGDYIIELDMVQEHVAWFADKGSLAAKVRVTVHPNSRSAQPVSDDSEFVPRMEMHAVYWLDVVKTVAESGGTILDIREDALAPGWVGYRYCVAPRR